ncbi:MAG: PriCT-2 domain-containing protein [Pseudomonadota bacterium]
MAAHTKSRGVKPFAMPLRFEWFAELMTSEPLVVDRKDDGKLFTGCGYTGFELVRIVEHNAANDIATGCLSRAYSNVSYATMKTFDYDSGDVTFPALVSRLEELGHECLIYETFSNTPDHPRLRLVMPLAVPVVMPDHQARSLWKAKYCAVAKQLGGTIDRACSDPNRLSYVPMHQPGQTIRFKYIAAKPLDYNAIEVEPLKVRKPSKRVQFDEDTDLGEVQAALEHISADCGRDEWLSVIFALHSEFGDDARDLAEQWSGTCPERFDEADFHRSWDGADPDRGTTIATLWYLAQQNGFRRKPKLNSVSPDREIFAVGSAPPVEHAEQCAKMLVEHNRHEPTLFSMKGELIRVRSDGGLKMMQNGDVAHDIERHVAEWWKGGEKSGCFIGTPPNIAAMARAELIDRVPTLDRIVETPFFDAYGNLVAVRGYHEQSRTFYAPSDDLEVALPAEIPTRGQLQEAVDTLREPLDEFPYTDEAAYAHTIAMILQPIVREMISGPTPAYMIHKPTRGTGASLLVDAVSLINSGSPAPIESEKKEDEEWRKMLTASLLSGASMILIDNVHRFLDCAAIPAFITADAWSDRKLGSSEKVSLANKATLVFTGNNPQWSDEIDRRLLSIRLDAKSANPEHGRDFRIKNLKEWIRERRSKLVSAALLIVQSWIASGRQIGPEKPLASFESYTKVMSGILRNAGITGFLGDKTEAKPSLEPLNVFVEVMWTRFGETGAIVGKLEFDAKPVDYDAHEPKTLVELLLAIEGHCDFGFTAQAQTRWGNNLGRALTKGVDRVFALAGGVQVRLRKRKTNTGAEYALEAVGAPRPLSQPFRLLEPRMALLPVLPVLAFSDEATGMPATVASGDLVAGVETIIPLFQGQVG